MAWLLAMVAMMGRLVLVFSFYNRLFKIE